MSNPIVSKSDVKVGEKKRFHLSEQQIIDIGKARKAGDNPRQIAGRTNIKLATVRNVLSELVKQGVVFPKLVRSNVSRYVEIAKKLK